jgi:hypothetical protein
MDEKEREKEWEKFLNSPGVPRPTLISEIQDLKRAHCEVTNANTTAVAYVARGLGGVQAALWAIAVMMLVGTWRHW